MAFSRDQELNNWTTIIRSCLLTSKTPLTVDEINRDTKMLEGAFIPFRKLGYQSLEEMLRGIPGLVIMHDRNSGRLVVKAIASEESAHISKMVSRQKSSKKKPRRTLPQLSFRRPPTYRTPQFGNKSGGSTYNKYTPYNNYNVPPPSYIRSSSKEMPKRPQSLNFQATSQASTPRTTPIVTPMTPKPTATPTASTTRPTPTSTMPTARSTPVSTARPTPTSTVPTAKPTPTTTTPLKSAATPTIPTAKLTTTPKTPTIPKAPATTPVTPATPMPQKYVSFTPPGDSPMPKLSAIQQRLLQAITPTSPTTPTTPITPKTPVAPTYPNLEARLKKSATAVQVESEDPRLRLSRYADDMGLPLPIYKDVPTKSKDFFSCVTIDKKKYSSYPHEAKNKDDAEKIAAKIALEDLQGKEKKPDTTTKDRSLVVKRILAIVNDHPNGLFESSLVDSYTSQYNEGLPKDWLKSVENFITIDIGASNTLILCPQKTNVQRSQSLTIIQTTEPEVLKLGNLDEFWLHIYVVYSTTDVWGVIIDDEFSSKVEELAKEMRPFYDNDSPATKVVPGKYYTVFDSEWHRVRCLKYDTAGDIATVFFIDRGDEDVFPSARLFELRSQFCKLPQQAVQLSLVGLELFVDCDEVVPVLEDLLLDMPVLVKIADVDPLIETKSPNVVSANIFYEKDEVEVHVNELLKDEIFKVVDPTYYISTNKVSQEVHISQISEKAVFVQVRSKGLRHLQKLLHDVTKELLDNVYFKPRPVLKFDLTKIYATKSAADDCWYRVKLTKIENDNLALAFCIDVGHTVTVQKSNLVLLEDLSDLLSSYPAQAVQIKLHKVSPITFDKKMANHLRKLAPKTETFYMKVVDVLENIPVVVFYKRTKDNLLASLNDTLIMEQEICKDDNNNARRVRNERSSIGYKSDFPLPSPNIPSIGSYFDVLVTMAAHPGNFTVQPLNSAKELESLMSDLTKVCERYNGPILTPSSIKIGSIYAAKYDGDGRWYRGYVSKVISKNVCVVYYCDYGDFRAVAMDQLQILDQRFLELPYQAIKAKLYGVTPVNKGDWSVRDSLRFIELTVEKSFVSTVRSCESDSATGDMILGLELINTSTSENIYISNILIDEKRASKLLEA